jgi:hypothetical protein
VLRGRRPDAWGANEDSTLLAFAEVKSAGDIMTSRTAAQLRTFGAVRMKNGSVCPLYVAAPRARRFWDDMRKRFEEFSLSLNPDKTRLMSSAALRRNDALVAGSENRRPSTFLALPSSVNATAVGSSLSKEQHGAIACGQRSGGSRRNCDGACTNLSPSKGPGSSKWSEASSPTMPCRPTALH